MEYGNRKGGGYRQFIQTALVDGIHTTERAVREWMEVTRVMGGRVKMRDGREVRPEEYMGEGKFYRCGEGADEGRCTEGLMGCERCHAPAGHNSRTCLYIAKMCRRCGQWEHPKSECGRGRGGKRKGDQEGWGRGGGSRGGGRWG